MKRYPGILLAVALCLCTISAQAQELPLFGSDDPSQEIPELSGPVDMAQAVRHALLVNPRMESALASIDAAEAGRYASISDFLPTVTLGYSYTMLDHPQPSRDSPRSVYSSTTGQSSIAQYDDDVYTATLEISQTLFAGFRVLSSYQKSALQEASARVTEEAERIALIQLVQQNYLSLLKARENLRSAQDSLTRLQSQLQVTQAFHEVGLRPRLDVLQAEVDLATAEDNLIQAETLVKTQEVRLNTLLLIPEDSDVVYEGELAFIPFTMNLDDCLAAAENRPDMRLMRQAVEIAGKDVNIAASGFYPQVVGQFSWSSTGNTWAVRGQEYDRTEFSEWSATIALSWQIFDFGRTYFGLRQAQHAERQYRAQEQTQYQEMIYQVTAQRLAIEEAEARITVAQKGLEQAKEAYRMAVARYQAQVGTNTDVLDAQAQLTSAEAQHTEAMADYLLALANMYAAMGQQNVTLLE